MSDEKVNHPAYYGGKDNPFEAIKVIEAWGVDFCIGNALKYLSRAGKKEGSTLLEDLKKAEWYLRWRYAHWDPKRYVRPSSGNEDVLSGGRVAVEWGLNEPLAVVVEALWYGDIGDAIDALGAEIDRLAGVGPLR